MPRRARRLSSSKIYHVVFRGINKQDIFYENEDYEKMLKKLAYLKEEMEFQIFAYCLMSNHVHLLIKEENWGDISTIIKRLLISYVGHFNKKYKRIGKLINDRYLSLAVEDDSYILNLIRYIHQNPVKIGLPITYKWSSYKNYFDSNSKIIDNKFVISMMGKESFIKFNNIMESSEFEPSDKLTLSDYEIKREIIEEYKIMPEEIILLDKIKRSELLSKMRESYSIMQISRITGISRNIIFKSTNKCDKSKRR